MPPAADRLPDEQDRESFRTQLDHNFSVIAPAGVGKTTAIIQRILRIAETDVHREAHILPRLAMVTYTKKAAAEMRERARQRLMDGGADMVERLAGFNTAYFGTIHSFCLELLRNHGFAMGLPPGLELVEDDEILWREFIRGRSSLLDGLSSEVRGQFTRYADLRDLNELARRLPPETEASKPGAFPELDFSELLAFKPGKRAEASVAEALGRLSTWIRDQREDEGWLGLPSCSKGGKEFVALWGQAFAPLRDWLASAALAAAVTLASQGRDYRLAKGKLRYDDMISLARDLMAHPTAGDRIRREGYHIILDEAQDTDPSQFDVLLEVAREPGSPGGWREGPFPGPGRFCMVGDPQQSIYSDRADIKTYLEVHQRLLKSPSGREAAFTVTMRCDKAVVSWVNTSMPEALDGDNEQVSFVPLIARPKAGPGQVFRLDLDPPSDEASKRRADVSRTEADALAALLAGSSPHHFGVEDWSEVALLCPRRNYLETLASALEAVGVSAQNHSRLDLFRDDPAYAWVTALVTVAANPNDAFEVAGILRNLFVVSDDALARYVAEHRIYRGEHPLTITREPKGEGEVSEILDMLRKLRHEMLRLPLREAFAVMLDKLQLAERLASLPGGKTAALASLAHYAAQAEEAGETLNSWAGILRRRGEMAAGEADPESGSIQLFTCHKAKGLEWPVVILPFLFAPIGSPGNTYPMVLREAESKLCLAWDKDHDQQNAKAWEKLREEQTRQRLLYVAMTRPRQRLVLVNDEPLFPSGKHAFAEYLGLREGEANRVAWESLPVFIPEMRSQRAGPDLSETISREGVVPVSPEPWPESISYLKRILPSSLAKHHVGGGPEHDEPDLQAEPKYPEIVPSPGEGTAYGNWWHEMMETLPWSEAAVKWQAHCDHALEACPDTRRGQVEIALFLQSPLAEQLSGAVFVRTEVPLLWRASGDVVYDGSIDLLARLNNNDWLVVDWKTDRVGDKPQEELMHLYGGQLDAYRSAVADQHHGSCRAVLYSTRTGCLAYCR